MVASSSPGSVASASLSLEISGDTFETVRVDVRTRPGATIRVPGPPGQPANEPFTIYAATFEHVAGPTRPIEGVVRASRYPGPAVRDHGPRRAILGPGNSFDFVARYRAQGHYRLVGLPRGREGSWWLSRQSTWLGQQRRAPISPRPRRGLPYLRARVKVGDSGGREPVKLDINLKRGIWVAGESSRTTRGTGPCPMEHFVFADNPHLDRRPGFSMVDDPRPFLGAGWRLPFRRVPGPWSARGPRDGGRLHHG